MCFAWGHPKDDATALSSQPWRHIGDRPYWAGLAGWAHSVQDCWPHERNLLDTPLQAGECVCSRTDCASNMYILFLDRRRKLADKPYFGLPYLLSKMAGVSLHQFSLL